MEDQWAGAGPGMRTKLESGDGEGGHVDLMESSDTREGDHDVPRKSERETTSEREKRSSLEAKRARRNGNSSSMEARSRDLSKESEKRGTLKLMGMGKSGVRTSSMSSSNRRDLKGMRSR